MDTTNIIQAISDAVNDYRDGDLDTVMDLLTLLRQAPTHTFYSDQSVSNLTDYLLSGDSDSQEILLDFLGTVSVRMVTRDVNIVELANDLRQGVCGILNGPIMGETYNTKALGTSINSNDGVMAGLFVLKVFAVETRQILSTIIRKRYT